ncbi:MAG: hypothetical protein J5800_04200 [Spirochaetales bacterium]|nr:hypothetical protein [Spirochaetales bacterium]
MAKDALQKVTVLPYGTTSDNIVKLLDSVKNKEGDEKGIKAIYSGSKIEATQSALETLGIIKDLRLTDIGKQIVFETDEKKKQNAYLHAILSYSPYEYFITYLKQRNEMTETELETVKNYWGRNNYGTPNNRSEGATVCFTFFQLAGLGEYVVGRKGKATRFVWKESAAELINQINNQSIEEKPTIESDNTALSEEYNSVNEISKNPSTNVINKSDERDITVNSAFPASIEIKVDMTDWDIERIREFFSLISRNNLLE